MTNIWDKINLEKESNNVLRILNEQAELLANKTDGLLYAEVTPVDAYEESTMELGIVYNMYVHAPYLGNFKTMLITVVEISNKIIIVDRVNENKKKEFTQIDQLLPNIEAILETEEVSKLILNLYQSSLELKK